MEKELAKIRAKFGEDKSLSGGLAGKILLHKGLVPSASFSGLFRRPRFMFAPFAQAMTGESTSGSSCISICWALTLTSVTSRRVT